MAETADTTIALKRKRSEDGDRSSSVDADDPAKDPPANPTKKNPSSKNEADKKNSLKPIKQTWQSGDFRKVARSKPPYNGLEITAQYKVDASGTFEDVSVTFTDYTHSKDGISSNIKALSVGDDWVQVPKPSKTKSSDKSKASEEGADSADFTVLGHVKISREPNGKFLRLRLKSGLAPGLQQLGFIMRLSPPPSKS